ncbi:MAG: YfhO family protein [Bacteroidia bacterium]|nr:YfhO family protein [Bacteroidia bacterium]
MLEYKDIIKKTGIHLLILILFVIIDFTYFTSVLEGKRIIPPDNMQNIASGKETRDFYKETGEQTLWTNSVFSGMPTYHVAIFYPYNFCTHVIELFKLFPLPVGYVLLYFIGFYIMFCCLRFGPWLSFIGSIAVSFTSYNFVILEAGHNTKAMAIAFMGIVLGGIFKILRREYRWGLLITAIGAAFEIRAKHIQITYYLFIIIFIILIVELIYAIKEKRHQEILKAISVICLAAIIGVGVNTSLLWTTYEYANESKRGKSELTANVNTEVAESGGLSKREAFAWSYGFGENLTFLIPDIFGGTSDGALTTDSEVYKVISKGLPPKQSKRFIEHMPLYWGSQPFVSGPAYMGAIVCFLFVMGLFLIKGRMRAWMIICVFLSAGLAMGNNFSTLSDFFFNHIPLYNKFRAVTMFHAITALLMVWLGITTVHKVLNNEIAKEDLIKGLRNSAIILGGLTLLIALFTGSFFNFDGQGDARLAQQIGNEKVGKLIVEALIVDRRGIAQFDAWRSFGLIMLTAGIFFLYAKSKLKSVYVIVLLGILFLVDAWPVNKRYLDENDFDSKRKLANPYKPNHADKFILKDEDPHYRVYEIGRSAFASSRASYFHKSIGGYNAAKLMRYDELMNRHIAQGNRHVISMLNTKYIIVTDPQTNQLIPQRNLEALGNAWYVDSLQFVENADEEIKAITDFNPRKTAIVDVRFEDLLIDLQIESDTSAEISLSEYQPNHLTYFAEVEKEQIAVFSEVYYEKGWQAYIDDKEVPHFRVNYILRALVVPPGEHKIEFRFKPKSFYLGEKISLAFSTLLIGGFLFLSFIGIKDINQLEKQDGNKENLT